MDTNLSPAEVLCCLYNRARTQGLGILHFAPKPMTVDEAQKVLDASAGETYFDYYKGRVMKIDVAQRPLNTFLYNRDNGNGAAELAISVFKPAKES